MKAPELRTWLAVLFLVLNGKYAGAQNISRAKSPNIILILADDLGFYPATFEGNSISATAGKSLKSIFLGKKTRLREELCWEHNGAVALRQEARVTAKDNWELYNLIEDHSETNNLASNYPERVTELKAKWELAKEYKVFPKP